MNITPPWEATLSDTQHGIILFFLVFAGLAMFAQCIRSSFYGSSVAIQYKSAAVAGVAVAGVAFLSYVFLLVSFVNGYVEQDGVWVPNSGAEWSYASRYAEWAVSVPLLVLQLFTVAGLSNRRRNFFQGIAIVSAFLMVFTGYLGGVAIDGGKSLGALWIWGLISSFFFAIVYGIVIYTTIQTMPKLNERTKVAYRNAMVVLLITWMVYPAIFGFQGFTSGGTWTMVAQIALSCADVAAKVGFGTLLFQVARQRTEDDLSHGAVVDSR